MRSMIYFLSSQRKTRWIQCTYKLPLAQLDRFLFKIRMDHVAQDAELKF